jgi:hypothetical protein
VVVEGPCTVSTPYVRDQNRYLIDAGGIHLSLDFE